MKLLLSVHDVTPALATPIERLWELCARLGCRPALLVVPNWHGAWPLERHPSFVRWLRARAEEGAEIFLHGERHDEVGLRRRFRHRLRALGRTAGEAEFLAVDDAEGRARIERGVALLRGLGLPPIGFVPPAWLASAATGRLAAACDLAYGEDEHSVHLYLRGVRLRSPAVRWSSRGALRAHASSWVAAGRWLLQRRWPLVRVALHPGDLGHPRTAASLRRALPRWLAARPLCRYGSL